MVSKTAKIRPKSMKTVCSPGSHMFSGLGNLTGIHPRKQHFMVFIDDINHETVKPVIDWILNANFADDEKPELLSLLVCSSGGALEPAMCLIDIIRGSNIPVATIATGGIASAAVMLVMAGTKGKRYITEGCSVMSHQYSAGTGFQKHHELIAATIDFNQTQERIERLYQKCTGMDRKLIREILLPANDVFLTPEQALEYKIVDKIINLA